MVNTTLFMNLHTIDKFLWDILLYIVSIQILFDAAKGLAIFHLVIPFSKENLRCESGR